MNQESQETKMEDNPVNNSNSIASYTQPPAPRNQRKFPIPKEVNRYMLQYYAARYYNAKPEERLKISQEISINVSVAGYNFEPEDIDRRLKNMKAQYRRRKEDYQNGIVKSVDWEYYQILDAIFANQIPKRRYTRIHPVINQVPREKELQPIEIASTSSSPPHFLIPKIIMNAEIDTPEKNPETDSVPKRKSSNENQVINAKKVKAEKTLKENENAIDMSLKKPKVIEFNNIGDICQQLPITNDNAQTTIEAKNAAIKRISEEFQKLDRERLHLDEMSLQLAVKRNEIDKAAYTLTTLLNDISNA